jgi:hypothetical protein
VQKTHGFSLVFTVTIKLSLGYEVNKRFMNFSDRGLLCGSLRRIRPNDPPKLSVTALPYFAGENGGGVERERRDTVVLSPIRMNT